MDSELACIDGRLVAAAQATIPVTDRGLIRGDGVFEVIRLYAGRPYALDAHLDAARALGGRPAPAARRRGGPRRRRHAARRAPRPSDVLRADHGARAAGGGSC